MSLLSATDTECYTSRPCNAVPLVPIAAIGIVEFIQLLEDYNGLNDHSTVKRRGTNHKCRPTDWRAIADYAIGDLTRAAYMRL